MTNYLSAIRTFKFASLKITLVVFFLICIALLSAQAQVSWVTIHDGQPLPKNALVAGAERTSNTTELPVYVCRAPHGGGVHPGKLLNGSCQIGYGDSVITKSSYEVAVSLSGSWGVPKSDFVDALVAGYEGNKQPLYLCRAKFQERNWQVRRSGEPVIDRTGYHGLLPGKIVNEICDVSFI